MRQNASIVDRLVDRGPEIALHIGARGESQSRWVIRIPTKSSSGSTYHDVP
jgi:hypothetical protein